MENATQQLLESTLPQLGISAIFIVVAVRLYKDSKQQMADKDKKHSEELAAKDDRIKEMQGMLQGMYEKNLELHTKSIEVMTQLKDVIDGQSKSLDKNTEALVSLEKKIIQIS